MTAMTRLSVNINKFATLRNARGSNLPNLETVTKDCERFGAEGITIHPRPDERHIKYADVPVIKRLATTELNIEGNPIPKFIELVLANKPAQVTLVPDAENALTSNAGWDTVKNKDYLKEICGIFKKAGIRTSIFVDPVEEMVFGAAETGCDRIELYTEAYARNYAENPEKAIEPYVKAANAAKKAGLGLNAGHDLNLANLRYFKQRIDNLLEVSIGHALICDAIYMGLENTIQAYKRAIKD